MEYDIYMDERNKEYVIYNEIPYGQRDEYTFVCECGEYKAACALQKMFNDYDWD